MTQLQSSADSLSHLNNAPPTPLPRCSDVPPTGLGRVGDGVVSWGVGSVGRTQWGHWGAMVWTGGGEEGRVDRQLGWYGQVLENVYSARKGE